MPDVADGRTQTNSYGPAKRIITSVIGAEGGNRTFPRIQSRLSFNSEAGMPAGSSRQTVAIDRRAVSCRSTPQKSRLAFNPGKNSVDFKNWCELGRVSTLARLFQQLQAPIPVRIKTWVMDAEISILLLQFRVSTATLQK
ncbi:hypothetical protein [Falsirhodobacter algicola]|uniref:Uncharacterized protein n=1 Tax=Falsirhodobacter algicola TaxID=2692330 RepID=A0A8J8MRS9_9RHOB|nr:hypothetical protein [Falsirhodobacter algicola]QUS35555.1 hypothetical protein GR316_04275 [Falsirhodobacter algicola]